MKFFAALMILALMVATVLSQAPMSPLGAAPMAAQQGAQQSPNLFQMLLYRNMFDMNWLHALLFSNGFGGMGGAGGAGGALPWLLFGNM